MAGNSNGIRGGAITGINVTPLVDITLVLLIIFMVTAKLVVNNEALPLDLPRAASGSAVQQVFNIALFVDGTVKVNGEAVHGDDALVSRAKAAVALDREVRAVIDADGSIAHWQVMHVLDILRQAGASKIGFGVAAETAATVTHGAP